MHEGLSTLLGALSGDDDDPMTGHLETLTEVECRALLAGARIGRVAITADALPVIAPVNYVVDRDAIYFRTRRDGMLARACNDSVIAFEIDEVAADGQSGWTVNVVGIATLMSEAEQSRPLALGLVSAAADTREQFVRMQIGLVNGRRITSLGVSAPAV